VYYTQKLNIYYLKKEKMFSIIKMLNRVFSLKAETDEKATSLIINLLNSNSPAMIARFGSVEIKTVIYPRTSRYVKPLLKKLMGYSPKTGEFLHMKLNAGFFPSNINTISDFSNLMYEDMKELDILGSWRFEESFLRSNFPYSKVVKLDNLEPYLQDNPWSKTLEGKNVLVIHPFSNTIETQYHNKRSLLFRDPRVLPKFKSLQTIRAVQTIAGNISEFENWFQALEHMKTEIDKKVFDVAIIGCGAYGFPLAAHIKRLGKKAVHLGGATQILFGIKGKRWVDNPKFSSIINDHFVFPLNEDKVDNASVVEDACYW
jgi:hypothetical protein